jgi:hypothetical protein
MHKTLDHWFKVEAPHDVVTHKQIFYFDSITMDSKWLYEKNPDIKIRFSTIIKWNKARSSLENEDKYKKVQSVVPITLCTNLSQKDQYFLPPEMKYNKKHITFLKSNLQKCIRRQLNEKAIRTAYHLIKIDINEFLRRLCIIILEDVKLHECYSTIVWLMAITSSTKVIFRLTKNVIDWLLGVIDTLCNINECDAAPESEVKYKLTEFNDYDLLYSLQFRMSYGGMRGDVEMLNDFTSLWYDRFKNNEKCSTVPIKLIDSSKVKPLSFEDWKLEGDNMAGIDYHCAPFIVGNIAKEHNYTETEIKSAIWNCSSKINTRKPNKKSDKSIEIWNKIEQTLYKLQGFLLTQK